MKDRSFAVNTYRRTNWRVTGGMVACMPMVKKWFPLRKCKLAETSKNSKNGKGRKGRSGIPLADMCVTDHNTTLMHPQSKVGHNLVKTANPMINILRVKETMCHLHAHS